MPVAASTSSVAPPPKGTTEIKVIVDKGDAEELEEEESLTEEELSQLRKKLCPGISASLLVDLNSPSFRCLGQILVSRSSLLRNPLYFPPLKETGKIDDAFDYVEPEPVYDDVGVSRYQDKCKEMNIVPMSRVIKSLGTETLDLRYHGLRLLQMRAITAALKVNTKVRNLLLQDNWMSVEQSSLIGDMLAENSSIRYLNMTECRIGPEGAEKISEGITNTQFIWTLDLSFNSLGNDGLRNLLTALCENTSIKTLILSHNDLDEGCADVLDKIMAENMYIEELDLSWNNFNTPAGNKILFRGLARSKFLKYLNLAWNGVSQRAAAMPIRNYLRHTETLEELDLSWNRLQEKSLAPVRRGLTKNKSLVKVHLGNNPFSFDESLQLVRLLAGKSKSHPLQFMSLENKIVTKEALPLLQKIRRMGKEIVIGGILSNYEIKGPDAAELLFNRFRYIGKKPKKKKARKDFGHFILSLPDQKMIPSDFETALKKFKIKKLDKDLIKELLKQFTARNKKIDCVLMREKYMQLYPDTTPPPLPKKKGKKGEGKKGKGKKKLSEKTSELIPGEDLPPAEEALTNELPAEVRPTSSVYLDRLASSRQLWGSRIRVQSQEGVPVPVPT